MQLPCFKEYRDIFYPSNVKVVPYNIYELLTLSPLGTSLRGPGGRGLVFGLMDDGSRHGSGVHIGVYAYINTDVDKLMSTLQDKFNI